MPLFPFWREVRPMVRFRKNGRLPEIAGPPSDSADPLPREVLRRLEEWGLQNQGDDFSDATLADGVLSHFEEWGDMDQADVLRNPSNAPEGRTEQPMTSLLLPLDRAHPLWDRDLDG
jgi:hypothetical protein